MFVMFTIIQVSVSALVIMRMVRMAEGMPGAWCKRFMHHVFNSVLTFLAVNLLVSIFLALFTGSGSTVGMANIASSVVVSIGGRKFYNAYRAYLNIRRMR